MTHRPPATSPAPFDEGRLPALRDVIRAVWPSLVVAGSLLLLLAFIYPYLTSGDETSHMDYAWQLWHGRLPVFEDGVQFRPGRGQVPAVQLSAQHPPLFYLLLAPVIGPLIDAGHPFGAVLIGRLINTTITLGDLVAIGWAVTRIVPGHTALRWATIATAFAALISPLLRTGSNVYNDMLAMLITVLALGLAATVVRFGVTRWRLVGAAALGAAAMLVRANSVVTVAVLVAALLIAGWRGSRGAANRRWLVTAGTGSIPLLSAAAFAGWFYVHNVRASGSWTGGHYEWGYQNLGRQVRSMGSVLAGVDNWLTTPWFVLQRGAAFDTVNDFSKVVGSMLLIGGSLAGAVLLRRRNRRHPDSGKPDLLVLGLLLLQLTGVLAMFVVFVMAGGGENSRYFLPALVPVMLIFASTVMVLPRRWQWLWLTIAMAAAIVPLAHWVHRSLRTVGWSLSARTANDVPMAVIWLLMVAFVAGLVITVLRFRVQPAELHRSGHHVGEPSVGGGRQPIDRPPGEVVGLVGDHRFRAGRRDDHEPDVEMPGRHAE